MGERVTRYKEDGHVYAQWILCTRDASDSDGQRSALCEGQTQEGRKVERGAGRVTSGSVIHH